MRPSPRLGALVGAAVLSLTLAACGSDSGSSSSTSSTPPASVPAPVDAQHDAADTSFAQDMIVHHQGAISMAQLATTQASTQPVKDLARRIEAAQGPEITEMTSWLRAWGEPTSPSGAMAGMDHSSTSSGSTGPGAAGMVTGEQVDQLRAATGTAFDRAFLQMMTTRHQGAIEMARAEQAHGASTRAVALARTIETSQTAEVTEMGQLLQGLG